MTIEKNTKTKRTLYLTLGTISMVFAGIIYAWSILKMPLADEFGWSASQLALNYSIGTVMFCIGGLLGSRISRIIGGKMAVILAGILSGAGFVGVSFMNGDILLLFLTYSFMGCLGIGVAYNVLVSTVNAWFPDRKGFSSGCLMMGFGASALLIGNLAASFFDNENIGWQKTFIIIGVSLFVILFVSGLVIKAPQKDTVLPEQKKDAVKDSSNDTPIDMTPAEVLKRSSFWRAFFYLAFMGACGGTVISFARDLAVSVGAAAALATSLVGVLSVCNGLGRVITGLIFDKFGRKVAMSVSSIITILAAGIILISSLITSLPLCVLGLCFAGMSYGSCPTVGAAFTASFYGPKNFPTNFSMMNFNLLVVSLMTTLSSELLTRYGTYVAPFIVLIVLGVVAFFLNITVKKP